MVWNVLDGRQAAVPQGSVELQVLEVLGQRESNALGDAAIDLALDGGAVDDGAHVNCRGDATTFTLPFLVLTSTSASTVRTCRSGRACPGR